MLIGVLSPAGVNGVKLWMTCNSSDSTSGCHASAFSGFFAGILYDRTRTGRPSIQFFSFVAPLPISGTSTISGFPSPSRSTASTR